MRYHPKSPEERRQMLEQIGAKSVAELFGSIPSSLHLNRALKIEPGKSEPEILSFFEDRAKDNASDFTSFLGAGAYDHYRPSVVDALISRSEFYSAYTPYQPEISQGTLQAIFEFQTLICQFTGMDVANASLYDGSTALPEAVMMAVRVNGRKRILLGRSIHPEYRQVLHTYLQRLDIKLEEIDFLESGQVDSAALAAKLGPDVGAVVLQSPNFFGVIEDVAAASAMAHEAGALSVVMIAEPVSLGIVRPPTEADIVAGEGQPLGIPVSFGGPYVGFIGAREQFVRNLPGRLVGETTDARGNRAFCLTLATREQHIRREKATSNICTNQALCALMATVFLTIYGKQGMRELALQNMAKTQYAASAFLKAGASTRFSGPRFNELVVRGLGTKPGLSERLKAARLVGGLNLGPFYPEFAGDQLFCFTETAKKEQIDRLVEICTE